MADIRADVVVVGLGAAGSATACHLARRGIPIVGIDQFAPPHGRGSTHSESRIIRKAYAEGKQYVPLLARAYWLWESLEKETGQQLITRCGCLVIGRADSARVAGTIESARAAGIETAVMTPREVHASFPAYRLKSHEIGVFEHDAGAIDPERAVAAHLAQARALGARLLMHERMLSWHAGPHSVTVRGETCRIEADRMVLAAGAWVGDALGAMRPPVRIERVVNAWFPTSGSSFSPTRCPTFIWDDDGTNLYGFPDFGHGLKAGLHHEGTLVEHPSQLDRKIGAADIGVLYEKLLGLFPEGLAVSRDASTCMYTNTPDLHYLIDHLPGTGRRVVVQSACSGHGFKASAAVGEVVADLVLGREPRINVDPFRWRWS